MRIEEIKKIVESRNIKALLHFTRLENIPSILENGLVSRSSISAEAIFNDHQRLDERRDTISLSISFPNYLMFYKYRQDMQGKWCVIGINPAVLWDLECLFCKHNAADSRISSLPDEQLTLPESLADMFVDSDISPTRADLKLQDCDPTDPQAEVLVKNIIPKEYILGIVFPDTPSKEQYLHLSDRMKIMEHNRNKGYFASRTYVRR